MATGKRLIVIDRDIFSGSVNMDPCRMASKKYWHPKKSSEPGVFNMEFFRFKSGSSGQLGIAHGVNFGEATYDNQATFYKINQKVRLNAGFSFGFEDADEWSDYVNSMIVTDTIYYDHAYELCTPFLPQELEKYSSAPGAAYCNVEVNYNFYIETYESLANSKTPVPVQLLPNIYAFMFEKESENTDDENTDFNKLITLQGAIPDVYKDIVNRKGEKIGESDEGQYFDKYAFYYDGINKNPVGKQELMAKYTNIAIPIGDVSNIGAYNDNAELYPMYMDIQFSTDKTTQFAEIVDDTKLSTPLMSEVARRDRMNDFAIFPSFESLEVITQQTNALGATTVNKRSTLGPGERRIFDITDWWLEHSNVDTPSTEFTTAKDMVYLTNTNDADISKNEDQQYYKNMLMLIFAGKFRSLIRMTLRDMQSIYEGNLAHSETVMYRIAKYKGKVAKGRPVQNFYIPNSNDIDLFRFIDTQVKYAEDYTYRVYAYQLVMGSKYSYSNLTIDENPLIFIGEDADTDRINTIFTAEASIDITPSVKLIETPYFSEHEIMMDDPPVPPEAELIPYKGINNKILINLNGNVGEYLFDPITIHAYEDDIIAKVRKAQKNLPPKPIRYKSDDHPQHFEIFRIEKHPTSHSDFKNNIRATIHTDINRKTKQKATSAAFVDYITPNKKYYYMFRTVDNHHKISNPSPIYELEMVDENGMIFPIIKVVDFIDTIPKKPSKSMNRYLYIAPALNQTVFNEKESGLYQASSANDANGTIVLGNADEDVWTKKFKIRITSKATGKKIDLIVTPTQEHIKTEADEQTYK